MSASFEYQPVLHGDLIELRPLRSDAHDALYAVASDPLIWEQHPNNDRHQAAVFSEFIREALASGGALVVSEAGTGRLIGSSRFHAYDPGAGEVEDRLDLPGPIALGRQVQRGDEAAHAGPRLPLRALGRVRDRAPQPAVAAGRREDRRRARGDEARGDGRESVVYRITAAERSAGSETNYERTR
jgi:hypothetical protein